MRTKVLAAAAGLLFLVGIGLSPVEHTVLTVEAPDTETDVEWFGGTRTVAQWFVSPANGLSAITVRLRPPVSADGYPILARVRDDREHAPPLRTATLKRTDTGADGFLTVRFAPIRQSAGRTFVITFEAPDPRARFALAREIDRSRYDPGRLLVNGRDRPGVLGFALEIREPRAAAVWRSTVAPFLQALRRHPRLAGAFALGVALAALTFSWSRGARWQPRWTRRRIATGLALLSVAHFFLHFPFVTSYPAVNDEGAYLMDVAGLRHGFVPFRDTLAKGPVFLAVLAPWVLAFPPSLPAARLLAAAGSALALPLLALLAARLGSMRAGAIVALLWAFAPTVLSHTSQLFPQAVELPLALGGLLLLVPPTSVATGDRGRRRAVAAGVLLAGAVLARVSALAFLPAALLLPLALGWVSGARRALTVIAAFTATLALVALLTLPVLGPAKTAVLFNLEAARVGAVRTETAGTLLLPPRELLERAVAFGASLYPSGTVVLLLAAAFVLGRLGGVLRLPAGVAAAVFLGVALPLLAQLHRHAFFLSGERASASPVVAFVSGLAAAGAFVGLFGSRNVTRTPRDLLLTGGTWLALVLLYLQFGRFRQHYHVEFLVLYVLAAGFLLADVFEAARSRGTQRVAAAVLFGALAASILGGYGPALAQAPAGSLDLNAVRETAAVVRRETRPGDAIFTAQPLPVFLAERRLLFGAAHPGWYLEEANGTIPTALRRLYLPDKEVVRQSVRDQLIRVVLIDRRTREVYLQSDPEMQKLLAEHYRLLTTIPNELEDQPIAVFVRR